MPARSTRPSRRVATTRGAGDPPWLPALLIAVAVIVAYVPAMRGGYIWDDPRYVTENPVLRSGGGLAQIWFNPGATIQYYPLVFTTFWIEHRAWGLNPIGYHVINVLLHTASAVLLGLVLSRLSVRLAWLAAALFALHPIQVESVAWITERKNVLSGLFYFAAMLAYLGYARPWGERGERGAPRLYLASIGLFACALLSKTVTCSLPAALLVITWWKRGRIEKRDVVPLLPMFATGAVMASVTSWMEATNVEARGPDWDFTFVQRATIAGRALWFYLAKLAWPVPLIFNYERWLVASVWPALLAAGAAVALVLALWIARARIGRGPLACALLYGGTLFPALGFVNTYPMRYAFVADHFVYLACIAPLVFAVQGASRLLGGAPPTRSGSGATSALVVLAGVLGFLTWQQSRVYANEETLWLDTLSKNPSSFLAHNNLGVIRKDQGRAADAIAHFTDAIRLKPNFHEAHYNLGSALLLSGRAADAMQSFERALVIRPDLEWAHAGMGDVHACEGRLAEAIASYREALRIDPAFAEGHNNLANALARSGQTEEAEREYRAALRARPDWHLAHANLANALAEQRRLDEAVTHYREAIRLNPAYAPAYRNMGIALSSQGKAREAIEALREAAARDPRDAMSRFLLGEILSRLGDGEGARAQHRAALAIDPAHEPARRALAALTASPPAR